MREQQNLRCYDCFRRSGHRRDGSRLAVSGQAAGRRGRTGVGVVGGFLVVTNLVVLGGRKKPSRKLFGLKLWTARSIERKTGGLVGLIMLFSS